MEKTLNKKWRLADQLSFICLAFLGCGLITLCSLVKIPFYPVSFTLQTFAIFVLALTQSPKQAFGSAVCYLLLATIGFPVLCGSSNPLWMCGKCGGYLIAFPLAAYLIAKLRTKKTNPFFAILVGQAVIFFLGFIWLIPFFGVSTAWAKGVLLFIPSDLLKNLAAIGTALAWRKWRKW